MSDGDATLRTWITRLRSLGPAVVRDAAPKVRKVVDDELRQQIARGQDPYGRPLAPTQDGRAPLTGAGKALTVTSSGKRITATLEGPEARHHLRRARGGIRRQILPGRQLPKPMADRIRTAVADVFHANIRGAR